MSPVTAFGVGISSRPADGASGPTFRLVGDSWQSLKKKKKDLFKGQF